MNSPDNDEIISAMERARFFDDPSKEAPQTIYWAEQSNVFDIRPVRLPVPPDWMNDEQLERATEAGFQLRYLPITPDTDPDQDTDVERLMAQTQASPGWHLMPEQPLDGEDVAELIFGRPQARTAITGKLGFSPPPTRVYEFYCSVPLVGETMPASSTEPARIPTAAELFYLLRNSDYDDLDTTLLCNNGPDFQTAVSIQVESGKIVGAKTHELDGDFYGAIYPMQKIS